MSSLGSSDESDEEFVWLYTSNDDSDSEVEMPYDVESESGKSYKKKLQKQLIQNGELDSSAELAEPRRKKKKHKRDKSPCHSPAPLPSVKRESLAGGHDDSAAAELILNMKVKEERESFAAPRDSPRKRRASSASSHSSQSSHSSHHRHHNKKRKHKEHEASTVDGPQSPRNKKKRKRDSERASVSDQGLIIDKFEAEETVVQQRPKVNGHARKEKLEHRPQEYPSKEFIEVDDSSEDESPATPARSDADTESPRKTRLSERITFESQSESEPERAPKTVEKSQESTKRTRKTSERQSESSTSGRKTSEKLSNGERTQSISERITFEQSQPESEPPKQARRISDRITFEESQSDAAPGSAAGLGRFLRARAHLRPAPGALPPGAAVSADDDVWLVRAPADLPLAALRGLALPVDGRGKLKVGGRALEAAPVAGAERVTLLAPAARGRGLCVRSVALRGALRLRARLPRPRASAPVPAASPERVPPPDTRPRHPLLGAAYEQAAALSPDVRRRLAAAARRETAAVDGDASEPRERKKKKKKRKERPEPELEPKEEVRPETEEPKKRKRKHSSRREPDPPGSDRHEPDPPESDSPPRKKKVKKEKRDKEKRREEAAVWDSERAIEESLFNF